MEQYDLGDHLQAGNALLTAAAGHQPAAARSAPSLGAASPDDALIASMSVKELREQIAEAGLPYADCVEKPELRARAREARQLLAADAERASLFEGAEQVRKAPFILPTKLRKKNARFSPGSATFSAHKPAVKTALSGGAAARAGGVVCEERIAARKRRHEGELSAHFSWPFRTLV
jgi:hypothetical protein